MARTDMTEYVLPTCSPRRPKMHGHLLPSFPPVALATYFDGVPSTERVYPTVHDMESLFSPPRIEINRMAHESLIGLCDCGLMIAD
jgi:hypothetical protein